MNDKNTSNVIVKTSKDTVSLNEDIRISLYLKNYDESRFPDFFFIDKNDTLWINFDKDLKCGIIDVACRKRGKIQYNWNVSYLDKTKKMKEEKFTFSFFVK